MDFPVTAELATTANYEQLHNEARGTKQRWPASFVEINPGEWVYRVDRDDIDAAFVQAALDNHVPIPVPAPVPLQAQIDELRGRLDRAANAPVSGEAAVLADSLKEPPADGRPPGRP